MKTRALTVAIVLLAGAAAYAQQQQKQPRPVSRTFPSEQQFPLAAGGTLFLENPVGDVVIFGKDGPNIDGMLYKRVDGVDKEAVEEGNRLTKLLIGGDEKVRSLRIAVAPGAKSEWSASVAWRINVPRTATVRVITRAGDIVQISGMRAPVHVHNINGRIVVDDHIGPAKLDSINGSIFYITPQVRGNVMLTSVNGDVMATVPRGAGFRWIGETVRGDIRTNFPARGTFIGNTFTGSVNAPGGPTIRTSSLMGNIQLIAGGVPVRLAQSVKKTAPMQNPIRTAGPTTQIFRGKFKYATNLGDVRVQQVVGDVDIFTGAGEVQLGAVSGSLIVKSRGGPLQFGEIDGPIEASTRAGDILIDSARRGGEIQTQGGTIRLLYTSGPTRLYSGGGDIIVRQAAASIEAETLSGDISVAIDGTSRSQRVEAKTAKGNVVLNVMPQFGADIDATILTSDPDADTIFSDIPGLSISRDQVAGKTRVRATGKINGGGEKIVLQATDGDIRISTGPVAPTVVTRR